MTDTPQSNLEALQAELEETREAMEHHDKRANYHLAQYMALLTYHRELADMLPGLTEAEVIAQAAWGDM